MRAAATAALVAVLIGGCGSGATDRAVMLPDGAHASGSDLSRAVSGLCKATGQASRHPEMAASTFYLSSHAPLHTLAIAVGLVDRARSARLLEAMFTIERDTATNPPRPSLGADLATLTAEAGADLELLHVPAPACTTRIDP